MDMLKKENGDTGLLLAFKLCLIARRIAFLSDLLPVHPKCIHRKS